MLFIDKSDGSTILLVGGQNVLEAAEIAKREGGRLRMVVSNAISTSDPMVGCEELGDWRDKGGQA